MRLMRSLLSFAKVRLAGSEPRTDDWCTAAGGTNGDRVVLHVGFGHSATTSLQTAFFAHRSDIFYPGTPYGSAGGFFSYLKYHDDCRLDVEGLIRLGREELYHAEDRRGRPIVISDETITDCCEVYYAPRLLPVETVATRLKRFFPRARIVFTFRHPREYVSSMYFNLKRNYAHLAKMPMPPFREWWDGLRSQEVCWHLSNLNYAPAIDRYAELFGRENLLLLPLEELKRDGPEKYLGRLCRFMGVELTPDDVSRFQQPRNVRMTVAEERLAEAIADRRPDPPPASTGDDTRAELTIPDDVLREIHDRAAPGIRRLVQAYGLPLDRLGYPV